MAIPPVALKRANHRLLLCADARKNALLEHVVAAHPGKNILVVTAGDTDTLIAPEGVTVTTDATFSELGDTPCELLISYDLPENPLLYMLRLARAGETALTLFGESDHKQLLAIETLLGRAITQEQLPEFAPAAPEQKSKPSGKRPGTKPAAPGQRRPEAKTAAPQRKPKGSGVSRFIGLDENGKPKFSGKTGERNHRKDGKAHTEESLAQKREWEERRKQKGEKPASSDRQNKREDGKKPKPETRDTKTGKPSFKGGKKPFSAKAAPGKADNAGTAKRPPRRFKSDPFRKEEK